MNIMPDVSEISENSNEEEILKEKALYILYVLWSSRHSSFIVLVFPVILWIFCLAPAMMIAELKGLIAITALVGILELCLLVLCLYQLYYVAPCVQQWCRQKKYRQVVETYPRYLMYSVGPGPRSRKFDADGADFDGGDGGDGGGDGD
ncbi:hypothetical protein [Deinococcus cellulosilyticus]|uniref:Uncharacterized protein n=1 Tax=Deinococcus cellulosilyticus (strain DSM 18568 / NBRC 106333 / KACC 11606 / 5516J-15) TaxID=1223518 RepID=A0A511NAM0_DEIC1|nr:hypothetical protein [Deinococcus cellulosilyticus]GEM49874.1 hypothetical protein DC3_55090 [Deinococcus cellulosilyticus NBRC 106333 = KACC 11606]